MSPRYSAVAAIVVAAAMTVPVVAAPAQATVATPRPVSATPALLPPCPLTAAQLDNGRRVVAQARHTLDVGSEALPNGWGTAAPSPTPFNRNDAELCALAIQDLAKKTATANLALELLGVCVIESIANGRNCDAEAGSARAALHDLEVAINNLKFTCPWLFPF